MIKLNGRFYKEYSDQTYRNLMILIKYEKSKKY